MIIIYPIEKSSINPKFMDNTTEFTFPRQTRFSRVKQRGRVNKRESFAGSDIALFDV